jgi:hypothetical protein
MLLTASSHAGGLRSNRLRRDRMTIQVRQGCQPVNQSRAQKGGYRLSKRWPRPAIECDWARSIGRRDQLTCAQVLQLTAAQADTSLMPNSAASCRYVRPSALRARSSLTFPLVSLARG